MITLAISYLVILSLSDFVYGEFYEYNSTDLTHCNVSYSRTGSTYTDFYPVEIHNDTLTLDFHFAVLATSDAHILLSPTENVTKDQPVYEIVIGAGGNTFCDIRRMQKSDVRHSVRIKGLLSALDPHFFWLHITKGTSGKSGLIEVGREGDNTSFIDWLDPELLPIKFISFSTWSGIEAKWYFNCDRTQNEEEIEKRLSALEKLRRNLLFVSLYDPLVRPVINQSTITKVSIALNLEYLEVDEYKSTVEIRGTTTMKWHDEKIKWNPRDYNNVTLMHALGKEVWKPDITCYSTADNPTEVLQDTPLTISNVGEVTWKPAIHVKAVCDNADLSDWPRDLYTCKILFGFAIDYGNIVLSFNDSQSSLLQHGTSQWLILDASVFEIESSNVTADSPSFGLYFEVKRSSSIYNMIFFVPFLVIAACLLLSFWIPPNGHLKLSIGGAQLVIEIIMLLALAHFVPRTSGGLPFLVALYSWCLGASVMFLIISILIINMARRKNAKPLPHAISNFLTNKNVKNLLRLPKVVTPEDYGDLDISLSSTTLSRAEDNKGQHLWALLGIAIDRISFCLCIPVILFVFVKYLVSCF